MPHSSKQIRLISGKFGGRFIDAPATIATHPMGNRERQALFNSIRDALPNATVLDAFAGSGALGLEAISNGAKQVIFLEKHPTAIQAIRANYRSLSLDAPIILRTVASLSSFRPFDIIFADPPYGNPQYELISHLASFLKPNGLFVLSHPEQPSPPAFDELSLVSDRQYAAAHIKIYQKTKNNL
ncbi:RsmD family RNA methyltransferase [Candidatus Saccharibacteria bacterium]|nr:RsmD family RNA methyltransferase [Candidatus Saccharibacteria bacterium]